MIKYLISVRREHYIQLKSERRQLKVLLLFGFFYNKIICRGNESFCCLLSTKNAMGIASFVPRCTWFVHAIDFFQQSIRTLFA